MAFPSKDMVKFLQNKLTNQEISININMCLWQTNAFETGVNKILSWLSQIQNKKKLSTVSDKGWAVDIRSCVH